MVEVLCSCSEVTAGCFSHSSSLSLSVGQLTDNGNWETPPESVFLVQQHLVFSRIKATGSAVPAPACNPVLAVLATLTTLPSVFGILDGT